MIDALATNHTAFLREPDHFEFLRQQVLPALAARDVGGSLERGLFHRRGGLDSGMPSERRVAIPDHSHRRDRHLQQGAALRRPGRLSGRALPRTCRRRGCRATSWRNTDRPRSYRVCPRLRTQAGFRRINLVERFSWHRRFPVIFCRNVMIYFDRPTQERVVGTAGGMPGARRLSVRRSRGEPDAGLARAGIRAAGGLPEIGETGGQMDQIVVGMADCRIGDVPGQVLATYALGSCIGLAVHDPKAVGGRPAAFHAAGFRHRSRPRPREPVHVRRYGHSAAARPGLRARARRSGG